VMRLRSAFTPLVKSLSRASTSLAAHAFSNLFQAPSSHAEYRCNSDYRHHDDYSDDQQQSCGGFRVNVNSIILESAVSDLDFRRVVEADAVMVIFDDAILDPIVG